MAKNIIRPPKPEELELVYRFMLACDVAEFGEPDSDLGDLTDQWSEADLSSDAWISLDPQGRINGYALFSLTSDERCDLDLYVDVHSGPQDLRAQLYDLGIRRFQQAVDQGKCLPESELVTYVNARNQPACTLLESRGFRGEKYHYRMQIDMKDVYPDPPLPQGFTLSTYTEADKQELFDLIVSAFDWEGRQFFDFETWQKNVLRGGRFDPDYFILLRQAGRLVGAALSYDEDGRAWLKELAIAADLRGRGLGKLLLQHVFHIFSRKGTFTVALGVVSTNPKAAAFYERAGMSRTREFVQYQLRAAGKTV